MSLPVRSARSWLLAAAFLALVFLVSPSTAVEIAPLPRQAGAAAPAAKPDGSAAVDLDKALIAEVKTRSQIMKNLQYLSDVIGPRLTGSKNLERANNWTADKMKEYGLVNVRLEPWEIPIGWERGQATMKIVEPDNGRSLTVASYAWTPGTNGKVTGPVVYIKERTKADLEKYKGKLKGAVVLTSPPAYVAPITSLNSGQGGGPKKDAAPRKDLDPKKEITPKPAEQKKVIVDEDAAPFAAVDEVQPPKKDDQQPPKKDGRPGGGGFGPGGGVDTEFLKAEGVACTVIDSGKPHGLLNMTGSWPRDRGNAQEGLPRVFMVHEHYALLYRLATQPNSNAKVETEITCKFIPGPITVYNTVGEVRGTEKPDEVVVVGAHLDSWDLGQGTTDNGTGSSVVLEAARAIAEMAKQGKGPKRTIRFCLYSGEEQGLWGSRKYIERHEKDMDKHSAAIVHDTGTGKVQGFGVLGRESCKKILDEELNTLKELDGWQGLTMGGLRGGTDHWSYHQKGVPGFSVNQDRDEYTLTHHSQSDTFDKAKEPNLIQGAQVMAVTAMRIANLPEMLPRELAPMKK